MNIYKIGVKTKSNEDGFTFAQELGLINLRNKMCISCGSKIHLESGKKRHGINKRLRCNSKECRKHGDPFSGTIFANSKLTVSCILRIIGTFTMRMKAKDATEHCKVNQNTINDWSAKITDRWIATLDDFCLGKIGGTGYTIEVDETHLYTNKRRIGRRLEGEKWWMVGGICRETGEIFLKMTKVRSSRVLIEIIRANIEEGTRIITDGWRGYSTVSLYNYKHDIIIHEKAFVDSHDPSIHTNTIERLWRSVKEFLPRGLPCDTIEREMKHFIFRRMIFSRSFGVIFREIINKII